MFGIPSNVLIPVIGIAVLVLLNTPAWTYVKSLFNKTTKKDVLDTMSFTVDNPSPEKPVEQKAPEIYEIVEKWDELKRMCYKAGLEESVKSLDAVFLNLLKRSSSNDKNIS